MFTQKNTEYIVSPHDSEVDFQAILVTMEYMEFSYKGQSCTHFCFYWEKKRLAQDQLQTLSMSSWRVSFTSSSLSSFLIILDFPMKV